MDNTSILEQRRRKALLVMPLVVVPFITLAFWALGGGSASELGNNDNSSGLNLSLPQANNKAKSGLDKLKFYEVADRDSAAWKRQMAQDRYSLGYRDEVPSGVEQPGGLSYNPAPLSSKSNTVETERLIYKKLDEINKQVATGGYESSGINRERVNDPESYMLETSKSPVADRKNIQEDGELVQLNEMMEKILDIQHPERVRVQAAKLDTTMSAPVTAAVVSMLPEVKAVYFGSVTGNKETTHSFISTAKAKQEATKQAMMAVVDKPQQVSPGSVVQLRMLSDVYVNGLLIPAGTMLHGIAALKEERLAINISSIVHQGNIYAVALRVYDLDGMEGVSAPASPVRSTASESFSNSFQSMPVLPVDRSLKTQAAGAGIQAVKNLVSKRTRQVKVLLPAGYQVLLKSSK